VTFAIAESTVLVALGVLAVGVTLMIIGSVRKR